MAVSLKSSAWIFVQRSADVGCKYARHMGSHPATTGLTVSKVVRPHQVLATSSRGNFRSVSPIASVSGAFLFASTLENGWSATCFSTSVLQTSASCKRRNAVKPQGFIVRIRDHTYATEQSVLFGLFVLLFALTAGSNL